MTEWYGLRPSALPPATDTARPTGSLLGLRTPEVDAAVLGDLFAEPERAPTQRAVQPFFSPSQQKYFVDGRVIDADDAQGLLEAEQLIGRPASAGRPSGDWVPIPASAFAAELEPIKNPSLGTLFTKGVGRGVDSLQLLGGRGLQLLGAEQFGGDIVEQQAEDLRRTTPFSRRFTDIESGGDAVEWFVANLGEQVPNILESVAVAGAGALAGTFAGGPGAGTAAGALAGLAGKAAFKQQVLAAARKKAAGEALDAAERKILRNAGAMVGATAATFANSYRTGAADIYGELRDQGADPDDVSAKMLALAGAFPYAAAESLPEFLLAGRIFGGIGAARALPAGTSRTRRGAELLRRGAVGGAVGGTAEGGTELAQESLLLGLSDQDFSDPENIDRLINAFAAGAAIGGPIGAVSNLRGRKPANLLTPGQNPDEPGRFVGPRQPYGPRQPMGPPVPEPELPLRGGGERFGPQEPLARFPDRPLVEEPELPLSGFYARPEVEPELPFGPGERNFGAQGVLPFEQGVPTAPAPLGTQLELPLAGGVTRTQPVNLVDPRLRDQQFGPPSDIQDVLPFESGLAPFRYAPTAVSEALPPALAANPLLQTVQRQAQFRQAQAAVPPAPEVSALEQRLAEAEEDLAVMGTDGRLTPEPQVGATMEEAEAAWKKYGPRGLGRKKFSSLRPEIREQWMIGLNKFNNRELSEDALRDGAARLNAIKKAEPVFAVFGDEITGTTPTPPTPPTPPKGGKSRVVKKPKAATVSPAEQPATRRKTLKRPAAAATGEPAGKPAAKPEGEAKVEAVAVPERQGKAVQALSKGKKQAAPPAAIARGAMKEADRLDDAIKFAEEATTKTDKRDVTDAYYDILELAFFERVSTGTVEGRKAIQTKARKFLEGGVSKWHRPLLAKAFRDHMLNEEKLSATDPWFQFMLDNDLLDSFPAKAKAKLTGLSKIEDAAAVEALTVDVQPAQTKGVSFETKLVAPDTNVATLTNLLSSMGTSLKMLEPRWSDTFVYEGVEYPQGRVALIEDLYAKIDSADRDRLVGGYPLKSYFKDGELRLAQSGAPIQIGTGTVRMMRLDPENAPGRFALADFNQPDRADPAIGKLRMAISQFVSKLATKPKVSVFKNQADLKAKNPALYRKAASSRPEGDFDTALAAGYSFGDGNVVIFSDRIANEQHLKFVLAHETLGHFGLRGIIPANKFDAVMESIYRTSPAIRSDVDAAMANREQSRAEAVEEYLSDFAATLDTSVVARVWNAIKSALNKLGIKFGDEMVRYILKQSRSYVRSGKSSMFDADRVFTDLQNIEYGLGPASTGRFSTVGDVYADNRAAELVRDNIGATPTNWEAAWGAIKGIAGNNTDRFDRFKAEFLSLANFRSRSNPGLNRLEEILEAARDLTSSIRVSSNERNAEVFNAAVFGKYFGVTEEQTASINKLMYAAQRLAVGKIKDIRDLKGAPLYDFKDGVLTPNQPEIDKLIEQGMVTFEQARDGFTYDVQLPDGSTRQERFDGIPGLTKKSTEWRGYLSLRETVNDVELQLLRARYQSLFEDQKIAFKQFDELVENKRLTSAERELLRRIIKTYSDLYTADIAFDERGYPKLNPDAMERGNDFVVAVNKALTLGQDRDFRAVADFFEGKAADDMVAKLREFKARLKIGAENKFTIQNRVKQILMLEVSNADADLFTRRTLATGYTPLLREGQFQVRVEAVNPRTGKVVRLADAYREQLIYSQVEKQSEAQELAAGINDVFKDKTYEVDAYSPDSGDFVKQNVVFRAVPETALDAIAGPPELNLNEFVYGLRQLDIVLTPKEVERVVTALTKQNSSARNRLLRAFTPGADPDAIKAISRHIDSRASTISKTMMRPQLGELMNLSMESTQRLWNGDPKLLADLKAISENADLTPQERTLAQREYERYKFMYEQTNPKGKPKRTNQFYNEASRTVAFLDDNRSVTESNFESGEIVSRVRAATSIMQLGGSIATGALNLISAYTNGLPFLASYNAKNGFGGGFGMGASVREFHIAAKQVGALGMTNMRANTAEFYDEVSADSGLQERYNLKKHEAEFIAREIREGAMIPAQTNALVNTARGQISSGFARKFIDGWMLPFNLTEQASRRTLGLAAYRLEYARQIEGGRSEEKAKEAARRFAVDALNLTMGEYSVLNRPPAWRSGIQSFLYMYKVFPTTSIQLFSNLSRGGKIAMLASLWLLSGLQGLPFAEDLEDLIDTLAQALGFKVGSIRMEIAKFIDGVFPGMSPYFLRGVVNSVVPADIAGRVSVGNLFPGTGALLSGADVGREIADIAGPAPSAIIGSAKFFADLMRAPFSDRIEAVDILREAPVTMLRAAGDTVAYAKSDAIVDRRGYVVADDANAGVIAARLLGFYPAAAAEQYSAIRIANRVSDYQRDVVAGFRQAWIKAKIEGDNARAREIEQAVRDWNKGAEGTGLEIGDFRSRSQRALKEAQRPAGERTLRTVPKAGRGDIEQAFDLLTT
jgi:hypothetical protein